MTEDRLLLEDGGSGLLLADGLSDLLLTTFSAESGLSFAVEFGFGSTWQTEPDDIVWYDETAYVLQAPRISTNRGASSARGQVDPGSFALTLLNGKQEAGTLRRFDPLYEDGPYFGQLIPGVPVRVTVTPSGQAGAQIITGTVSTWPQRWDVSGRYATVPTSGYDGFDKVSRAKTPQSAYAVEVLADDPVAFWRLDETSGTVMVDWSGNGNHGIYDNATLGVDPLIVDGNGRSATMEHEGDNRGQYKGATLPTTYPATIEAWVQVERDLTQWKTIVVAQRDNAFGSGLVLYIEDSADGSPNGELVINFFGLGGFYKARGSTRIDDGEVHHVVVTIAGTAATDILLYVDGALETKTLISGTTGGTWTGHYIWCVGNVAAASLFDLGLGGQIDEIAIYDQALSPARILAHYEAGSDAFDGDRSDERVSYILDYVGWPATARDFDTADVNLGPAVFDAGETALDYLRRIAASEDCRMHVTAAGDWRFPRRYWKYVDTASSVSQFTFTDADPTDAGYAEFQLDLDDELLVNTARYTRRGGAVQVVSDATSVATYGEAEKQQSDLLLQTDSEVLSLAEWIVATESTPQPRCPSIRVPLHRYPPVNQQAVLDLDLGYRVTVVRTPKVGDPITLDMVVDGISHDIGQGEWWATLFVSPNPEATLTPFRWDVSEWDGADAWAY